MDHDNASHANPHGDDPPAAGPLPEADAMDADRLLTANRPGVRLRGVLGRVKRRWWQILVVWMILALPLTYLAFLLVRPTFVASSILRIEPGLPELYGPLPERDGGRIGTSTYLKTQVGLIASEKVLKRALADPVVVNLDTIRWSTDPKTNIGENLKVEIIDDTNLIRVSLGLPNPDDAVVIVKSVVASYLTQNTDYGRSANRDLTVSLKQQLVKLGAEIDSQLSMLKELARKGKPRVVRPGEMLNPRTETDPALPTFRTVAPAHLAKMVDKQIECDLEYLEALSHLEATRSVRERNLDRLREELETRADDEFEKGPKVAALIERIDLAQKTLDESKDQAAVVAAREKHEKLVKEQQALRAGTILKIRKRLTEADRGPLSEATIRELEVAVETARRKKDGFAHQLEKLQVQDVAANDDAFEIQYLNHQIATLMSREDQVKKNLEQLRFEANQDQYRVVLVDPASAPKSPSSDSRRNFMASAPILSFLVIVCLFLFLEIVAGPVVEHDGSASASGPVSET
jgi:hypothetical protein